MGRILLLFTLLFWITVDFPAQGHPLLYPGNNAHFDSRPLSSRENQEQLSPAPGINWQALISETQPSGSHYCPGIYGRNYKNSLQYKHFCCIPKVPCSFCHFSNSAYYVSASRYANGFYLYFLKKIII